MSGAALSKLIAYPDELNIPAASVPSLKVGGLADATAMIRVPELKDILKITARCTRLWLFRNGINVKRESGALVIPVASLPIEVQRKVFAAHPDWRGIEAPSQALAALPEWQRREAGAWVAIIQECRGLRGAECIRRLAHLEGRFHGIEMSYQTYRRKLAAFEVGGAAALAPAWGHSRGKTKILPEWFHVFARYYLIEGGPAIQDAHRKAFGNAARQNPDLTLEEFGSHSAYKRLLDRHVSPSAQCYYRSGPDIWTRIYKTHIDRDPSDVMPGELWVSDHHQLDVGCMWSFVEDSMPLDEDAKVLLGTFQRKTPKPVFPWLTCWRDFRSGKVLAALVHADAPHSDHVIHSFAMAALKYGVPEAILIDNGKDYRCKAFAGGRDIKESRVKVGLSDRDRSICSLLGVIVHYATPYNAKAKPIERDFRKFKEWYCRYLPGYRGGNHVERPERLEAEIKAGMLQSNEELCAGLHAFAFEILNRFPSQGKYLRGQSPDEFWQGNEKRLRTVPEDELSLCCMRATQPREIRGRGVHDATLGLDYYADWMSTQGGRRVYLRRGLVHFMTAFVFDAADDRYLGRAEANYWQAKALVKDEEAGRRLRSLSKLQASQLKELREMGKQLGLGVEHIEPIADGKAAMVALERERGAVIKSEPVEVIELPASEEVTQSLPLLVTPMAQVLADDKANPERTRGRRGITAKAAAQKRKFVLFDSDLETENGEDPK